MITFSHKGYFTNRMKILINGLPVLLVLLLFADSTIAKRNSRSDQEVETNEYTVHHHNYAEKQVGTNENGDQYADESRKIELHVVPSQTDLGQRGKRGVKKYRHFSIKPVVHKKRKIVIPINVQSPRQKKHARQEEERVYRTYEETHEHIQEGVEPKVIPPDAQLTQASEHYETQAVQHYAEPMIQETQHHHQMDEDNFEESLDEPSKEHHEHEHDEKHEHHGEHKKKEKIKIKHHHHHHHHNHIKEVIKKIPEPYPVEKIVHVPVEKIVHKIVHVPKPYPVEKIVEKIVNVPVEKIVHVPKPYPVEKLVEKKVPYPVEKIVHVPVERIVEKIIHVPKPYAVERIVEKVVHIPVEKIIEKVIHVPQPYPVEKVVNKIVHVPKPYPVIKQVPYPVEVKVPVHIEKRVPYPVEKKVPVPYKVEVEKRVPVPYKVEVEKRVPVYIHHHEHNGPYKFEHPEHKESEHSQKHDFEEHEHQHHYEKLHHDLSGYSTSQNANFAKYHFNQQKQQQPHQHHTKQENQQQPVEQQQQHNNPTSLQQSQSYDQTLSYQPTNNSQLSEALQAELLHQQLENFGYQKQNTDFEPSTSESKQSLVAVAGGTAGQNVVSKPFKIHVADTSSTGAEAGSEGDMLTQASTNSLQMVTRLHPITLPFQLFHLHAMPFQQPLGFSMPIAGNVNNH